MSSGQGSVCSLENSRKSRKHKCCCRPVGRHVYQDWHIHQYLQGKHMRRCFNLDWLLPMQLYPLGARVAPALQVHVKEPMLLWQFWSQLSVSSRSVHSLISAQQECNVIPMLKTYSSYTYHYKSFRLHSAGSQGGTGICRIQEC